MGIQVASAIEKTNAHTKTRGIVGMTGWRRAVQQHTVLIFAIIIFLIIVSFKVMDMQKNKTNLHQRVKDLETLHKQRGDM